MSQVTGFTGDLVVSGEGVYYVGAGADGLQNFSNLTISAGATYRMEGSSWNIEGTTITLQGGDDAASTATYSSSNSTIGADFSVSGHTTLEASASYYVNGFYFTGDLVNTGESDVLAKTGSGSLGFHGDINYTGDFDIQAGSVTIAGTVSAIMGDITMAGGTSLTISPVMGASSIAASGSASVSIANSMTLGADSTVSLSAGSLSLVEGSTISNSQIKDITFSGSVSLTSGAATTLSGSNSIAAVSVGSGASLSLESGSSLDCGITLDGGSLVVSDGVLSNSLSVEAASSISTLGQSDLSLNSSIEYVDSIYTLDLSGVGTITIGDDFLVDFGDFAIESDGASLPTFAIFTGLSNDISGDLDADNFNSFSEYLFSSWAYDSDTGTLSVVLDTRTTYTYSSGGAILDADGATVTNIDEANLVIASDAAQSYISTKFDGTAHSVSINNDSYNASILTESCDILSSSTTIEKNGSATFFIGTGMEARQGIYINEGTIQFGSHGNTTDAARIAAATIYSDINIADGAQLVGGNATYTSVGADAALIDLADDGTLSYNSITNATLSNTNIAISGDMSYSNVTCDASNVITVTAGTLSLDSASSIGSAITMSGGSIVASDGTLSADINIAAAGISISSGTESLVLNSTLAFNGYSLAVTESTSLGENFALDLTGLSLSDWTTVTLFTSAESAWLDGVTYEDNSYIGTFSNSNGTVALDVLESALLTYNGSVGGFYSVDGTSAATDVTNDRLVLVGDGNSNFSTTISGTAYSISFDIAGYYIASRTSSLLSSTTITIDATTGILYLGAEMSAAEGIYLNGGTLEFGSRSTDYTSLQQAASITSDITIASGAKLYAGNATYTSADDTAASIKIADGGSLTYNSVSNATISNTNIAISSALSFNDDVSLNDTVGIVLAGSSASLSINGELLGSGSVTISNSVDGETSNVIQYGDSDYTGDLVLNSGVSYWFGYSDSYTNTLAYDTITVNEGATFAWRHGATTLESQIILNGGTFYSYDSHATNESVLSSVEVSADSSFSSLWGARYRINELSGSANLTIETSLSSEGVSIAIDRLVNYDGTIYSSYGESSYAPTLSINEVSTDADIATVITGYVYAGEFSKTGEGSLELDTLVLSGSTLYMDYEGSLSIDSFLLEASTSLVYSNSGGSIISIDDLTISDGASFCVSFTDSVTAEALYAGFDLGISSDIDSSLISIFGYTDAQYSLTAENGSYSLYVVEGAGLPDAANYWDSNWGDTVLDSAPTRIFEDDFTEAYNGLYGASSDYCFTDDEGNTKTVVNITGGDGTSFIFGGVNVWSYDNTITTIETDSWILMSAGSVYAIVGGNYCDNWDFDSALSFVGDAHISYIGGDVNYIIGRNYKDGQGVTSEGDVYISLYESVEGGVFGGSASTHNNTNTTTGDNNIYIYVPQLASTTSVELSSGNDFWNLYDLVVGGDVYVCNSAPTFTMTGNTNITVDLSEYEASSVEFFGKALIGGHALSHAATGYLYGDSNITIEGAENVTFANYIAGGAYMASYASYTQTGTSNVSIAGDSTFNNYVIGGSMMISANNTSIMADVEVDISGGTFNSLVIGGSYASAAVSNEMSTTELNSTITGGSFVAGYVGGHYLAAGTTGTTATGDINVTWDGGTTTMLTGGSLINGAVTSLSQGDITLDLNSGTITNFVAAAGYNTTEDGTAVAVTTGSTTVNVSDQITFESTSGDAVTVSGGYYGTITDEMTITGDRTLNFDTENSGYVKLDSVTFTDFDVVSVANDSTVDFGASSSATLLQNLADSVTKTGSGTLVLAAGNTGSLIIEEGAVQLTSSEDNFTAITLAGGELVIATDSGTLYNDVTLTADSSISAEIGTLVLNSTITLNDGTCLDLSSDDVLETPSISTSSMASDTSDSVSLGENFVLDLSDWDLTVGQSYTIVQVDTNLLEDVNFDVLFADGAYNASIQEIEWSWDGSNLSFVLYNMVSWDSDSGTITGGDGDYSEAAIAIDTSNIANAELNTTEGGTLVDSLTISGDSTITIAGEGALTVNETITLATDVILNAEVMADAIMVVGSDVSVGTNGSIKADTTLDASSTLTAGGIELSGGGTIALAEGGSITATGMNGVSLSNLKVTVTDDATFVNVETLSSLTVKSGTLTVTGDSSLAGGVTISGGTLEVAGTALSDGLTLSGGSLSLSDGALNTAIQVSADSSLSSGTDSLVLNSTIAMGYATCLDLSIASSDTPVMRTFSLTADTSSSNITLGEDFVLDLSAWDLTVGQSYTIVQVDTNLLDDGNFDVVFADGAYDASSQEIEWSWDGSNLSFVLYDNVGWDSDSGSITGGNGDYSDDSIAIDTSGTEGAVLNTSTEGTTVDSLSISGESSITIEGEGELSAKENITIGTDAVLNADISAETIIVEDSTLTVGTGTIKSDTVLDADSTLSAGGIELTGGGSVTFADGGSLTADSMSGATLSNFYVYVTGNASLVDFASSSTDQITIEVVNGTLSVTGKSSLACEVIISGGTLDAAGTALTDGLTLNGGTLNLSDGALNSDIEVSKSSTLSSSTGTLLLNSSIALDNGTSLDLSGVDTVSLGSSFELDLSDWSLTVGQSYSILQTSTNLLEDANFDAIFASNAYNTNSQEIEWSWDNGYLSFVLYDMVGWDSESGTITGGDGDYSGDSITIDTSNTTDAKLNTSADGTTVDSLTIGGDGAITIEGDGALTATEDITIGTDALLNADISASEIIVEDSTLTVGTGSINANTSLNEGAVLIAGGITLNDGGSLTFAEDGSLSSGGLNGASANGFYMIVKDDANLTDFTGDNSVTVAVQSGTLTVTGSSSLAGDVIITGGTLDVAGTALDGNVFLAGGELSLSDGSLGTAIKVSDSSALSSSAAGGALELNSSITMDSGTSLDLSGASSVSLGDDFSLVLDYSLAMDSSYTIFTGVAGASDLASSLSTASITSQNNFDASVYEYTWTYNESGDISLSLEVIPVYADWTDQGEANIPEVAEGGLTIFDTTTNDSGQDSVISTGSATGESLDVGDVLITGGGDVTISGESELSAFSLTIGDLETNTNLVVETSVSSSLGVSLVSGTITIADDGAIDDSDVELADGTSLSSGAITVEATGLASISRVSDDEATSNISSDVMSAVEVSNAAVSVDGTGTLSDSAITSDSSLTVTENSTLNLTGKSVIESDTTVESGASITLADSSAIDLAEGKSLSAGAITVTDEASGLAAIRRVSDAAEGSSDISSDAMKSVEVSNATVNVDGTGTLSDSTISSGSIVNITEGSTLNLTDSSNNTTIITAGTGGASITLESDGTMTNDYICGATIQGASISVGTIATSSLAMPTALMMTRASVSYSLTFENTSISNTSITLGDNESLYMNNVSIGSGVSLTVGTGASAYVTNSSLDLAYADVAQYISYTSDTVTITINLFDGLDVTLDGAISVNLDLSFEQYALLQTLLSSKELEVLLEGDFTMNAGTSMSFTIDTVDASGAAIEDALSIETSIGSDGSMLLTIIPEPSTATLSLLALAGLLARRRRKA